MPTIAELFWHFVTLSSGVTIGLMLAAWLRMQSKVTEETYDTDCEFVTEYIANMESGPKKSSSLRASNVCSAWINEYDA